MPAEKDTFLSHKNGAFIFVRQTGGATPIFSLPFHSKFRHELKTNPKHPIFGFSQLGKFVT